MQIQHSERDGVAVLTLDGETLGGPDGSALHDRIQTVRRDGGPDNVVVDLATVRHMNSSGLGMLLGALTSVRNAGGDLRLAGVDGRVATLLDVTRLADVFQSFPTADAAVASFAG